MIKGIEPTKPNEVWVSDITYLETEIGFVYISLITDAYSRKVVGYHAADNLLAVSSLEALKMALKNMSKSLENLIHNSDRGIQYCSQEYVNVLQDYQVKISMTQNGDPLENVIGRRTAAERINGVLKNELMPNVKIENLEHAQKLLKEIVLIYNDERPHISIALLTPNQAHQLDGKLKRYWKNYYKTHIRIFNYNFKLILGRISFFC